MTQTAPEINIVATEDPAQAHLAETVGESVLGVARAAGHRRAPRAEPGAAVPHTPGDNPRPRMRPSGSEATRRYRGQSNPQCSSNLLYLNMIQ